MRTPAPPRITRMPFSAWTMLRHSLSIKRLQPLQLLWWPIVMGLCCGRSCERVGQSSSCRAASSGEGWSERSGREFDRGLSRAPFERDTVVPQQYCSRRCILAHDVHTSVIFQLPPYPTTPLGGFCAFAPPWVWCPCALRFRCDHCIFLHGGPRFRVYFFGVTSHT